MTEKDYQRITQQIHPILTTRRCVAWVGSGLSAVAGYPGWPKLIRKLCETCSVSLLDRSDESSPDRLADKADECKEANLTLYQETLAEHFGKPPTATRIAYTSIMNLPFHGYVTTNYDPLLAYAAAQSGYRRLYHYPDLPVIPLGGSERPVFYIHGLARIGEQACGNDLVLSRSEFHEAYEGILRSFLDMLFTYNTVVFIGCRLREAEIRKVLSRAKGYQARINSARGTDESPHKVILLSFEEAYEREEAGPERTKRDEAETIFSREKKQLEELGVRVLRYDPEAKDHSELEAILARLCALEDTPVAPQTSLGLSEDLPSP